MQLKYNFAITIASLILLFFVIAPLFILTQYIHPGYDDTYASLTNRLEGGKTDFYLSGRNITFLYAKLLPVPDSKASINIDFFKNLQFFYIIHSFLMQILFLTSLFYFLYQIFLFFSKKIIFHLFILYSTLFILVIYNVIPNLYYFFYYYIYSHYTIGLACCFFLIGQFLKYTTFKKNLTLKITIFFNVLMLNETIEFYTVLSCFIIFIFFLYDWYTHKEIDLTFLFFFILSITKFFLYLFAPSYGCKFTLYTNQERFSVFYRLTQGYISAFYVCKDIFQLLLSGKFMFFEILFAVIVAKFTHKKNNHFLFFVSFFPIVCIFFIVTIMSYVGRYIIQNTPHIHNLISIMYSVHFLLLLVFISSFFLTKLVTFCIKENILNSIKNILSVFYIKLLVKNYIQLLLFFIALYTILYTTVLDSGFSTRTAWKDLIKGYAKSYNEEMFERYKIILNTQQKVIFVPELSKIPYTIFHGKLPTKTQGTEGGYMSFYTFMDKDAIFINEEK